MFRYLTVFSAVLLVCGCTGKNVSLTPDEINWLVEKSYRPYVDELSHDIAIFENVAFGLGLPLRTYLSKVENVQGKTLLDLGTGSGVLSLIAIKNGATKSIATEINPYAAANARYNADIMGYGGKIDVRLVSMDDQGAYSVIERDEKFDLIISNPPQGTMLPENIYQFSYADPQLAFLKSILEGLTMYLTEGGRGVFALYDNGLELALYIAKKHNLSLHIVLKTKNRNGDYYLVELMRQ